MENLISEELLGSVANRVSISPNNSLIEGRGQV